MCAPRSQHYGAVTTPGHKLHIDVCYGSHQRGILHAEILYFDTSITLTRTDLAHFATTVKRWRYRECRIKHVIALLRHWGRRCRFSGGEDAVGAVCARTGPWS